MVKLRGNEIISVTSNIANQLEIFGVERHKYKVVLELDDDKSFQPVSDALDHDIFVENVISPPSQLIQYLDQEQLDQANQNMRSFRVLSLFSGAGGIDLGLRGHDGRGGFKTKWAIDACLNSTNTLKGHSPNTKVFNMDVGDALRSMHTLDGMPKEGEVDVILMGTPCQPFSQLNRTHNKPHVFDPRSLLVATGMAFVDVYRPSYGLIENVCGMLNRGDCGRVPKVGIIRFIRACLLAMGYKVRFCKVQCGFYGIPQSRQRIKILFAKEQLTLPAPPCPTTRMIGHGDQGGKGNPVTILDATSDLPRWEFKNPSIVYGKKETLKDTRPSYLRPQKFEVITKKTTVGPLVCKYFSPPKNEYQQYLRSANPFEEKVYQHQTISIHLPAVERICNIPFIAGSNYISLLEGHGQLALGMTKELEVPDACQKAYGRLDGKGIFDIVTTNITLETKHGRILMPDQNRIPTLRELARAQGFHDAVVFQGSPKEIVRQIGNSVPIPLARAIGISIRQAAIKDYLNGRRDFARQ